MTFRSIAAMIEVMLVGFLESLDGSPPGKGRLCVSMKLDGCDIVFQHPQDVSSCWGCCLGLLHWLCITQSIHAGTCGCGSQLVAFGRIVQKAQAKHPKCGKFSATVEKVLPDLA